MEWIDLGRRDVFIGFVCGVSYFVMVILFGITHSLGLFMVLFVSNVFIRPLQNSLVFLLLSCV